MKFHSKKTEYGTKGANKSMDFMFCFFGFFFLKQLKIGEFSRESFNFPSVFYFNFKLFSLLWSLFSKVQQKTPQKSHNIPLYHLFSPLAASHTRKKKYNKICLRWPGHVDK